MFIIKTRKKHKGGGRLHGQRASLANEWFELCAAPPSPGAPTWEDRSLQLFRGTNKGWEKPGLHSGGARTLLLTSETRQIETPQACPSFLSSQQPELRQRSSPSSFRTQLHIRKRSALGQGENSAVRHKRPSEADIKSPHQVAHEK